MDESETNGPALSVSGDAVAEVRMKELIQNTHRPRVWCRQCHRVIKFPPAQGGGTRNPMHRTQTLDYSRARD